MITEVQSSNYNRSYAGIKNVRKQKQAPNFTGNAGNVAKELKKLVPHKMAINIMEKMKWFDGEEGRIAITAIGTGAIAPLFIAWNPYVKPKEGATEEEKIELKKTQKYTAIRQPISAALQILIQLSLLKPIYNGLDALFHKPENSKNLPVDLDKSVLQDEKYISRQIEKELKNNKVKFASKKEFEAEVSKLTKERAKVQIYKVANKLQETGQIHIGDRIVNNKTTAEAVNSVIDEYIKEAKKLQVDSDGMDYYKDTAKKLIKNKKEFTEIFNNLPSDDKEIANYLKQITAKTQNQDINDILTKIINLSEDERRSKCTRTLERIGTIENVCGGKGKFTPEKYMELMREDYDILSNLIEELKAAKIKPEEATPEQIKNAINKIADLCHHDNTNLKATRIFHDTKIFKDNVGKLVKKVCKDITQNYKGIMGKRYRAIKEIAGISIGLFLTTPVTCTALNWVYPRFMDLFFPDLSGKNKTKNTENKMGGEK